MKKLVSILVCLCVFSSLTSFAANDNCDEVLSVGEYISALKEEASMYGIDCSLLDYNPDVILTKAMLREEINYMKTFATNLTIESLPTDTTSSNIDEATPFVMPVTRNVHEDIRVESDGIGRADIRVDANVTVDMQSGNVMNVNSLSTYQYGYSINFDQWVPTSVTKRLNTPKVGYIQVSVKGRATFSHTNPTTGIKIGYTAEVSKVVNIECDL